MPLGTISSFESIIARLSEKAACLQASSKKETEKNDDDTVTKHASPKMEARVTRGRMKEVSKPSEPVSETTDNGARGNGEGSNDINNNSGNDNGTGGNDVPTGGATKRRRTVNSETGAPASNNKRAKGELDDQTVLAEDATAAVGESDAGGVGWEANNNPTRLYCLCRRADDGTFMIACDICDEWFHPQCVALDPREAIAMKGFVCPTCEDRMEEEEHNAALETKRRKQMELKAALLLQGRKDRTDASSTNRALRNRVLKEVDDALQLFPPNSKYYIDDRVVPEEVSMSRRSTRNEYSSKHPRGSTLGTTSNKMDCPDNEKGEPFTGSFSGRKTCHNTSCRKSSTPTWRNGWMEMSSSNKSTSSRSKRGKGVTAKDDVADAVAPGAAPAYSRVPLCNGCGLSYKKGYYCKRCFDIFTSKVGIEHNVLVCTICHGYQHKECNGGHALLLDESGSCVCDNCREFAPSSYPSNSSSINGGEEGGGEVENATVDEG